MDRWATFDCYGTLIDWNGGIGRELERLFGPDRAASLIHRYHEVEPQVQRENPASSYRDVLTVTLSRLGDVPEDERDALARSLPGWQPFPEVRESLEEARIDGWKLAIVASEIGSYKPAHRHWEEFYARTGADRAGHVHVGASLFHDIAPACELGLPTIWVNRLGEEARPRPNIELRSLSGLTEALDSLVA